MTIKYSFTRDGIAAFLDTILGDTFHALENGDDVNDIVISVGDKEITVPMFAEQYEELNTYLHKAIETEEEENA